MTDITATLPTTDQMLDLFGNPVDFRKSSNIAKKDDYDSFVNKFKPKLTTDDCYTPIPVYDAIVKWVGEQVDLSKYNIVRPFYPGGDYERYDYPKNALVLDNPPFSILVQIVRFYERHGIDFFLFAPSLTLLGSEAYARHCAIVCGQSITYENGAKVSTSFISSLFPECSIWVAGKLNKKIEEADKLGYKNISKTLKYEYPSNVLTPARLHRITKMGGEVKVPRIRSYYVKRLDAQIAAKKAIFGGGYIISDQCAVLLRQAEAEAEAETEAEVTTWRLSPREQRIIPSLSNDNRDSNGIEP